MVICMTEKYKIYLPEDIKTRLLNDAELFEFLKPDGSVNLNAFLKELIINYFDTYRTRKEQLRTTILSDLGELPSLSKADADVIANKIINSYMSEAQGAERKTAVVTLTVSGKALAIVRTIESNLLTDVSLSQYFKELFASYLSVSRVARERIIFREIFEELETAIKAHAVITFSTSTSEDSIVFEVEPYMLATSKEEQHHYLLCFDSAKQHTRSFRVSRMGQLFKTARQFEPDTQIMQELQDVARKNPQSAALNIDAKVRMTERGKKMFNMITKGRPELLRKEGNFYYFNWPAQSLEEYFRRFGKDGVIVEPLRSHDMVQVFYERGLAAYQKYPRRRHFETFEAENSDET